MLFKTVCVVCVVLVVVVLVVVVGCWLFCCCWLLLLFLIYVPLKCGCTNSIETLKETHCFYLMGLQRHSEFLLCACVFFFFNCFIF